MQDKNERKTRNLLATKNAQRQADFKHKKREQGFKQKQIWLSEFDFKQGQEWYEKSNGDLIKFIQVLNNIPESDVANVDKQSAILGFLQAEKTAKTLSQIDSQRNPD